MKQINSLLTKQNIYMKTFILSSLLNVLFLLLCIPFYFIKIVDITSGLFVGCFISSLFYLFVSSVEIRKNGDKKYKITILLLVLRLLLFTAILFSISYLFFKVGWRYINVFTYVTGYIIPLIIYVVFALGKEEKK